MGNNRPVDYLSYTVVFKHVLLLFRIKYCVCIYFIEYGILRDKPTGFEAEYYTFCGHKYMGYVWWMTMGSCSNLRLYGGHAMQPLKKVKNY